MIVFALAPSFTQPRNIARHSRSSWPGWAGPPSHVEDGHSVATRSALSGWPAEPGHDDVGRDLEGERDRLETAKRVRRPADLSFRHGPLQAGHPVTLEAISRCRPDRPCLGGPPIAGHDGGMRSHMMVQDSGWLQARRAFVAAPHRASDRATRAPPHCLSPHAGRGSGVRCGAFGQLEVGSHV